MGVTATPPVPYVHRMDNAYPPPSVDIGERRYWHTAAPVPGGRLVRMDILYNKDFMYTQSQHLTLTLVDMDGEEIHRDIPLAILSPMWGTRLVRPRYFKPFLWDPYKSYITQVGPVAVNVDVPVLAHFV